MKASHYQAKSNGGRNAGLYERFKNSRLAEIEKSRNLSVLMNGRLSSIKKKSGTLTPACGQIVAGFIATT